LVKVLGRDLSRRDFVKLGAASVLAMPYIGRTLAQSAPVLVNSIRSLANPYHATWNRGGEAFAQSVGLEYVTLVTEGSSEKGIADVRAMLSRTGGNMVLNIDPNDSPDARPIVEACYQAGATVVTQWNKSDDLHPRDFNPHYVSHISFSGVPAAKIMAETLFKAIGGAGGIVALGGIESNVAAIQRKAGLDAALKDNPNIELLDFQVANWSATEAFQKMSAWLTQFGDRIKGVFAANDDMALAVVEVLRTEGLAGKIPVTGTDGNQLAVEAILAGDLIGSVAWDPYWQGGMGLAIGHHARMGLFDPAQEPPEHREFYGTAVVITAENVADYYQNNIVSTPQLDWNDIWGRVSGSIE